MNKNILTKKRNTHSVIMILLLVLSFAWINFYEAFNFSLYGISGDILNQNGTLFTFALTNLFTLTLVNWLSFELICYFYRLILTFKIYSFVVPHGELSTECRKYFIYRNIFYGIFKNLCFIFPFIHIYSLLFNVLITMIILVYFAHYLSERYSEAIIGHFVFKCFCYPIIIYEGIILFIQILEVII